MRKWFGLATALWVGLSGAAVGAQESACLKGLRRERESQAEKLASLQRVDSTLQVATGGAFVGFLICAYKWRSLPGAAGCAAAMGGVATFPYMYREDNKDQIRLLEDSLILLQIYEDSKEGRTDSELVQVFMRENGIDLRDEPVALREIEQLIDRDMICNTRNGRPFMRLDEVVQNLKAKL